MTSLFSKLPIVCLCMAFLFSANAQNPYESLGIETEMLTLTDGKYPEFIPNKEIVTIGGVELNTITGEVIGFINPDTTEYSFDPTTSTRFLSVDPIGKEFPELTPYQFASNTPIAAIDLDGLEACLVHICDDNGETTKLYTGTEAEIYQQAIINVFSGLAKSDFQFSEQENLREAEQRVATFLSKDIAPSFIPKTDNEQKKIADKEIKTNVFNALWDADPEQQRKAINTINLHSKFFFNFPIASLADVIFPTSASLKFLKNAPVNIALGLRDFGAGQVDVLASFAKSVGALEVNQWAKLGVDMQKSFQNTFKEVTDLVINSGGKIKFNITSIDLKQARSLKGKGLYDDGVGYTQWEFNQILDNPQLLRATEFFENGVKVSTEEILKRTQ